MMKKTISPFAPIFIVGSPRSGTTLLSVLLDRHPDVAVTPETDFFRSRKIRLPLYGDLKKHVHSLFTEKVFYRIHDLGLSEQEILDRYKQYAPSYRKLFQAVLESYTHKQGKNRGGEKTPMHLDQIPLIFRWYTGAKAICIVRDGRDTALSLQRAGNIHGTDLRALSFIWNRHADKALKYSLKYPDRFFLVFYEALLKNPRSELERIDKFLDLDFNQSQLDSTIKTRVVTQKEKGWKANAVNNIDPGKSLRWQTEADMGQLIIMESVMRKNLIRFGYPVKSQFRSYNAVKSELYNVLMNWVYRLKTKRFNTGILGGMRKIINQTGNNEL
jgi:hypothetical protein